MLRITPSVAAVAAKSYFRDALSKGDYYVPGTPGLHRVSGQEIIGLWSGKGAERLGLSGKVTKAAFDRLCDNLHPVTGDKLTPRTKGDRRVAFDLTFSVPKSVSIVAELGGDDRIVPAFREAVAETLAEMEASMKTRVRQKGENGDRVTGELVTAEFVHFTSRPVDGVPDMHLHLHAFCFNCTWDAVEKRWKAGEFGDLKRDAPYHQAACDARLAEKLAFMGYRVERRSESPGGWKIAGIPEPVIRKFSRRTEEIERMAAKLNINDAKGKSGLGARTAGKKKTSITMEALREQWRSRLDDDERTALRAARRRATPGSPGSLESLGIARTAAELDANERRSIEFALAHALERASVVQEKRLLAAALEHGVGKVTLPAVKSHLEVLVAGKQVLRAAIDGELLVTTPSVLAEEQKMLATVREGRGQHRPLKLQHEFLDRKLSEEQRAAVRHVLESTSSVVLLRGRAGTGKTRTLEEVVKALGPMAVRVQVAAPTGMATHEVLRKEGFTNAETSAKVLFSRLIHEKLKGQVLWVDEAGLLGVPDLARLVELAREKNCRLLLTGDVAQHRSVVRGDALRLLETESGLKAATLTEVRRQKTPEYREAVETLAKGDLVKAFTQLDRMGAIHEAWDAARAKLIARTYVESVRNGASTLVVAPTHAEGRQATEAIRELLKSEGRLSENETTFERLHNRQLTEAERSDPRKHRVGDVVQFHQNAPGIANGPGLKGRFGCFRPGDRARVVAVSDKQVVVHRSRDDAPMRLPLHAARSFQSFEVREVNLAARDRVRITYTGRDAGGRHRLSNGAIYTIESIDRDGFIRLENGWRIPKGFGHLTHGYAVTSDASQGRTVDHVIAAQSAISEAASNLQQFYTTVTRGRHRVTIVTDDKDRLLRAVAKDNSRLSATEFMKIAREQLKPPGAKDRGLEHRADIGRWVAKESTRKMKEQANHHIRRERERRERDKNRTRSERNNRRRGEQDRGTSRER